MKKSTLAKGSFLFLFLLLGVCSTNSPLPRRTSREMEAEVERTEDGKLRISWRSAPEMLSLYWSTSPDNIEQQGTLLTRITGNTSIVIDDPDPTTRIYFRLVPENGQGITIAERRLMLEGCSNFRDLGGYKTRDGRRVKWGHIFRSEELAELTEKDKQFLLRSGLQLIYDHRSDIEVSRKPDPALNGTRYVHVPVLQDSPGITFDMVKFIQAAESGQFGSATDFMSNLTVEMAITESCIPAFATFFKTILDQANHPLVHHCTAGKDRTGFASALLLLALGVPESIVLDDYELSTVYRRDANQKMLTMLGALLNNPQTIEFIGTMLEVRREYLIMTLNAIKQRYGTLDTYFEQCMQLTHNDRLRLQEILLED